MASDIYPASLMQTMARTLSVTDLVRTTDTLKQSGQIASAEALYEAWIRHNDSNPLLYAILFNYSVMLSDAGKLDVARSCLERAIALNADFMPAYINLGRVLERQGSVGPALIQWSVVAAKLAAINGTAISHKTTALNQSARALEAASQDEAAEDLLRQSLDIDPHQREVAQHLIALRQRQCKWPVLSPWDRVSGEVLLRGMSPLSIAAHTDDPMLQLALAAHYNACDVGTPAALVTRLPSSGTRKGKLRIGYLSSDLREHAMGYLLGEVFSKHDRSKVETFAYYCGIDSKDPMHTQFYGDFDHWVSISNHDDTAAAKRIAEDGIHILVDLNGYTRDARLKVVAQRPAPIIVNWLGYPGTMGSPYHHYIIADDWIIPEESERFYSEKVLRLSCYQPSRLRRDVAPVTPTRREAGLPEDAMVYCCFNGAHKISRFTYDRWMDILARVPASVLWLLSSGEGADKRLRDHAASRGIAPERIIFATKLANPYHLSRYGLADLFLDTAPYGAHTTASDALWSGVPVLTLSGRSFASRVCGSLVRTARFPELVCTTVEDYIETAARYGNDRDSLIPLRRRLSESRDTNPLFNMSSLVRQLEGLYERMWADYSAGALPRPELAGLDAYLEIGARVDHEATDLLTLADYETWWREHLQRRHAIRPLIPDQRMAKELS